MIRLTKMLNAEHSERLEFAVITEALGALDNEAKYIIARCETDEEMLGLTSAVLKRAQTAVQMAAGDSVWIWQPTGQFTDGDGWRLCFEPAEALTVHGQRKQQAAQQAQARQMMAQMGGANGMRRR